VSSTYDKVKWYVESNAKLQALGDATTLPLERALEVVDDPVSRVETMRIIELWAMGDKVELIFTQCPKDVLEQLTDVEHQQLIDYWVQRYPNLVFEYLKKRIEGIR
jgi:hypothetical protein